MNHAENGFRALTMRIKFTIAAAMLMVGAAVGFAKAAPASLAYVLQADSLAKIKTAAAAKLAACGRDWIVLDAALSSDEPWTSADLAAIRVGRDGRRVIAYLSIGEAEDYRAYWRREWGANRDGKPDAAAPAFLVAENPDWKGNYRVKYWHADWQQIILADVDRIMAAGFDGLYLDIVDGFETFERDDSLAPSDGERGRGEGHNYIDDRPNPETKQTYRRDMVDWVKAIAAQARKKNPAALVIPQNGTQLLAQTDFLDAVDAVGVEDLFTNGDKLQPASETKNILGFLAPLMAPHKPVLDIEYPKNKERRAQVREKTAV